MNLRDIGRKIRAPFNRRQALNKLRTFHSKPRELSEVIDRAIDFKTKGLFRIDSVQIRNEILSLAEAVKCIKPKVILEIGTCNGGTLFIWSNIATDLVITCDLNESKIREDLYAQFPPDQSACRILPLSGNSHDSDFLQLVKDKLDGRQVDFLFIDGDHTESGVRQDYEMYSSLVRPGGLIAFHDIAQKQPIPQNQVQNFWASIKDNNETQEFINEPNQVGCGIGLLHVK